MWKYNRRQTQVYLSLAIANFCTSMCLSLTSPFYPQEAEKRGISATGYGFVFAVYQLTMFLSSPFYGRYLTTIGPSFVFSAGIFTTGVTCMLFGSLDFVHRSDDFVGLSFAIRIVEALGNTAFLTSSFSLIAKEFPNAVGATFATLDIFLSLGFIFGPSLGGLLFEFGGYSLPFFSFGCLLILAAIVTKFTMPCDDLDDANRIHESSKLLRAFKIPSFLIFVYSIAVTAFSIEFLMTILEPHIRVFGLSPFGTGLIFTVIGIACSISAPIWGYLCDRYILPRRIVGYGNLITMVALLLVGPAPFIPIEMSLPLCVCALLLYGFGFGAEFVGNFSGIHKIVIEHGFSSNINTFGFVSSIITSASAFGAFIGPTTAGYLFDVIGFDSSMVIVVALQGVVVVALSTIECRGL